MKEAAKLLYQGHASMRITTSEGKVIYVDPFAGEGYDKPADLILMTHGHYDHTQKDMITTKNPDCRTITWTEALKDGQLQSFDQKVAESFDVPGRLIVRLGEELDLE
nr:MBL fold metallo-hydrolase [uncultured Butyrivibrio sp.]